jgi:cis-L-3-hydroxyproline dehydratase
MSKFIVQAEAAGDVLYSDEGLSFWGGVDPVTGRVIDVHHPWYGLEIAGKILVMPTSRGSCSGSGVLLELALNGYAPAALIFSVAEETLTLGAVIAARLFDKTIAVAHLERKDFDALSQASKATIRDNVLIFGKNKCALRPLQKFDLKLSPLDQLRLSGAPTNPITLAMEVICIMAVTLGAERLTDVTRGHIDGCILAHDANLIFAERMAELGAKVQIPTTINAISVDRENSKSYGLPASFENGASRLADAYVKMGAQPTFTCAPYLLEDGPQLGENIGWSESNAVIFANSVLGARTAKLPDYLDLFVAIIGRAPDVGMYNVECRRPSLVIDCWIPEHHDDSLWPLLGWIAGRLSPDCVPLFRGLAHHEPSHEDLRALCAAFGTTSASPMLHVAGVTPEAELLLTADAESVCISLPDLVEAWTSLNSGPESVELVAIGSPHATYDEVAKFCEFLDGRSRYVETDVIVTLGRSVLKQATDAGLVKQLEACGVKVIPDLCWCSITEPIFPTMARNLMTNSGKYAHYAPGLCGRTVRFGSLRDCAETAVTGKACKHPPKWLLSQ